MKKNYTIAGWLMLLALSTFNLQPSTAYAQSTVFTYQGQLQNNGSPANGRYDLQFEVWDALANGNVVSGVFTNAATPVTNGLFTVTLDFGAGVFTGPPRWLEVDVRTNGNDAFTTLLPRQPILPTPYAIMANTASNLLGPVPAAQLSVGTANINITGNADTATTANNFSGLLSGDVTGTQGATVVANVGGQSAANVSSGASAAKAATSTNTANTIVQRDGSGNFAAGTITANNFSGDGGGLTNLNAGNLTGGTIADAWLSANVPLLNGTNLFTGTNTFAGTAVLTNANNVLSGSFTGDAAGLTNLNGSQLSIGTVANAQLANSTVTINAGTGLGGGGQVALGGSTTLANAGVLSVAGNADITAFTVNGAVTLGDTATSANTPSTVVKRDADGNFSAGSVALNGNLNLPATTTAAGAIYSGGTIFMHDYGTQNFFAGVSAGNLTLTGGYNTGIGYGALQGNTSGSYNTANGVQALLSNSAGSYNIGLGYQAGYSLTTGSSNIDIGNIGLATDTNTIRIGSGQTRTFIAGVINGDGSGLTHVTATTLVIPSGMALIPAGAFTMGDTLDGESDAIPANVYVSAFYMDVNLVSYSQWKSVYYWATNNGFAFDNAGSGKAANHPVQTVSWYDTVKWCNARSQQAGKTPVYYTDAGMTAVYTNGQVTPYANWSAQGYRLPTEAEWEKAARGGLSGQRFPWGNVIDESLANYDSDNYETYDLGPNGYNPAFATGGYPNTSPVGYFAPNGYGLYDMVGNVFEWSWDWYGTPYAGGTDPRGPASGSSRVLRGGVWDDDAYFCRVADRNSCSPTCNYFGIGFRSVLPSGQ